MILGIRTLVIYDQRYAALYKSCILLLLFYSSVRCLTDVFDCRDHNPCSLTLCTDGVVSYPGPWAGYYVFCKANGRCEENMCLPGHVFDNVLHACIKA